MKAVVKPRIELENRTKLEEVIPLDTPFLVFLDPSDLCNFQCVFCPTGDRALIKKINRRSGLMDMGLYKKVIDDLCEFERPVKVLRLYKDGEPLLNPAFAAMVRYAKKSGCALQVDTTTNGSLLNPERNLELIEAGLDRLHISVNGLSEGAYKKVTNYKIDFRKFVDNIRHFYENRKGCLVCVKIIGDGLSEDEKKFFLDTFGMISDRIFIEHIAPCWPQYEMQEDIPVPDVGIYGQEICNVEVCPYIFYSLSINSDGKVSLCFLDWARELIIGDAGSEKIRDIWNGEKMFAYRRMHLMKKRIGDPVCAACGQLSHCMPDNIDPYAQMLLERLDRSRTQSIAAGERDERYA